MGEINYLENARKLKKLREKTQIGLAACKKALITANWDMEKAETILFAQSSEKMKQKSIDKKEPKEGLIATYNHNNRIAAMVEINCETDFAAKTDEFKKFCDVVLTQIIGANPLYLISNEIPEKIMEEKAEEIHASGGLYGSMSEDEFEQEFEKWYDETCLLRQPHVNPFLKGKTVEELRAELSAKLGENVVIRRFVRWELSE